jgi:hypothetical protein
MVTVIPAVACAAQLTASAAARKAFGSSPLLQLLNFDRR